MTLYAYRCPSCGNSFEQFARYQEADSVACPSCQHPQAKRQLPRIAVRMADRAGTTTSAPDTTYSSESNCSTGTCPFV